MKMRRNARGPGRPKSLTEEGRRDQVRRAVAKHRAKEKERKKTDEFMKTCVLKAAMERDQHAKEAWEQLVLWCVGRCETSDFRIVVSKIRKDGFEVPATIKANEFLSLFMEDASSIRVIGLSTP